jgi:serine/threonine protein kinase
VPEASRPSTQRWQAGTLVNQRYRLDSVLRRGGMGSVWRAEHVELRSPVAIKVLEPEVARDPVMVQRFLREAQAAAALRSPNVVQILDYGVDQGQAFIAMEMLEGESLSERIARIGRIPSQDLLRFSTDVLRAMQRAHDAGIIHRDLKPDNIFICKDTPEFAKVLDFGVAKVKKGALGEGTGFGTQTGLMLGTPYYMSPEQAQAKEIDPRSDLWSIAVVAFEALLGRRPFTAEAFGDLVVAICTAPTPIPSKIGPVPPGFDEWFVRGTQRDPARRFASAREMAEELERVLRVDTAAPARVAALRSPPSLGLMAPLPTPVAERVSSAVARTSPGLGPSRPPNDLQLTTGQRSAVTRGAPDQAGPRSNAGLFALLAIGGLIVVAVVLFAMGGGARALREAELASDRRHAVATAPPAAPTLAAPVVPPGSATATRSLLPAAR